MTYFNFLAIFLILPITVLLFFVRRDRAMRPPSGKILPAWTIVLHVIIAVTYTTPWDNYLVATGVWWYDPDLVTGIVFGWVPIEEYTFFILQPILIGLWLAFWIHRLDMPQADTSLKRKARSISLAVAGIIWVWSAWVLLSGWTPGTYLGLELVWALPPVMVQLAFGADILLRHWRLVALGLVVPSVYLSAADALAIGWGTWTIDPAQSTGLLLGGILPIEEFVFFLLTCMLLTFGLVLIWAPESRERLAALRAALADRRKGKRG